VTGRDFRSRFAFDDMINWIKARLDSFRYALRGVRLLLRSETHARIHLLATLLVVALGVTFSLSSVEWGLIVLVTGLVWTAEAFNTAIERVVDLASPERHELAEKAKDLAASGVLLAAVTAVIVGLLLFGPRILLFLRPGV